MNGRFKEGDWKKLRAKLPGWQESYMEKLLAEYAEIVGSDSPASERFWALDERLREDRKHTGVIVHNMSRSSAMRTINELLIEGVITLEDLEDFSDEVVEAARRMLQWADR